MDERDEELEKRLRQFRPAAPSTALRERVLAAAARRPSRRVRAAWWSIAAAMAIITALHWQTARLYRGMAAPDLEASQERRTREIEEIAEAWGGTATARAAAEAAWMKFDATRRRADTSSSAEQSQP